MVELRKRKEPPPAPEKPTKKTTATSKLAKVKNAVIEKVEGAINDKAPAAEAPIVGQTIDLAAFGGEVETHDGSKTSLKQLVDESEAGIVLFTYPKASTPGCTTQACLFRDAYEPLTVTGLSIYGLSSDSPKANTAFKTKQKLPYPLLCDPSYSLIRAIGMAKAPKGTKRGVFVIAKDGKVLACEGGGPKATVDVVKKVVDEMGGDSSKVEGEGVEKAEQETDNA
ncbi:AhpC-TSA-domain-containing protein [Rhizodiscina lignyota]|uniref:thioredoxin-dependent peroxiredoxin n=1 Tax=Rhizodiscina lignyota TaxID=1504668 RepID=A0A9P4MAR3_9PEZI|nr:AhpC-TSA-domain-containing protein [Rhizodiscina lignyota]